jgi:hypothetical protein
VTPLAVIPTEVILEIEGEEYPLVSVDLSYTSLGLNTAVCGLATGRNAQTARLIPPLRFVRGQPARLYINQVVGVFNGASVPQDDGQLVLFDGVVDEGGPSSVGFGSFTAQVRLLGSLHRLNSGSVQTSNILPTSYADTNLGLRRGVFPTNLADDLIDDFGGTLLGLCDTIATQGVRELQPTVAALFDIFGGDVNASVSDYLQGIDNRLILRAGLENSAPVLSDLLGNVFTQDARYESFLGKIMALGDMLKYRLIELPSGVFLVPYTPFVSSAYAVDITPDTYAGVSWANEGTTILSGCALTAQGGGGAGSPLIVGVYRRPGVQNGMVLTQTAPPCLMIGNQFVSSPMVDVSSGVYNDSNRELGDYYAREVCLERAYGARRLMVSSPYFRTDIGPLTTVRVVYPETVEDVAGAEVYGSVQQVRISINAAARTASTVFDVGFVRSAEQQRIEIDEDESSSGVSHPFFTANVAQTRLDRTIA